MQTGEKYRLNEGGPLYASVAHHLWQQRLSSFQDTLKLPGGGRAAASPRPVANTLNRLMQRIQQRRPSTTAFREDDTCSDWTTQELTIGTIRPQGRVARQSVRRLHRERPPSVAGAGSFDHDPPGLARGPNPPLAAAHLSPGCLACAARRTSRILPTTDIFTSRRPSHRASCWPRPPGAAEPDQQCWNLTAAAEIQPIAARRTGDAERVQDWNQ
ncbi:MAG TPA: hypothetical protein VGF67_08030 [Ktedonobacteraceae bacterium]